jgi:3-hydroxyacyl-CoA dehydrogenase/enoyl-CoA hydratase/3-hydroxybutyryl-CoA epimerase
VFTHFETIEIQVIQEIVWLTFKNSGGKSLITLTEKSLSDLRSFLTELTAQQKNFKGLVFTSQMEGCFLAGMDIDVIASLNSIAQAQEGCEAGQKIFNMIEDLSIPTMSMVDGVCLGGGLELSLACNYIIASDSPKTRLGLPEVMLGVLPGFGGTYRMPKKIGLIGSLDLLLTGKHLDAKKALKLKLIDGICPRERFPIYAEKFLFSKKEKHWSEIVKNMAMDNIVVQKFALQKAKEKVFKQTKGFYPAPLRILEHLEKSAGRNRREWLASEALSFAELSQTIQSKSLLNVYHLTDAVKKVDKLSGKIAKVKRGAVLGAGTMGGGIAWLMADAGQAPLMKDINQSSLELGLKQASLNFKGALKRRKITEDIFQKKMASITPTLNFSEFGSIQLLIEAIVEDMGVKKKVLSEVEQKVSESCLITSNTSSLSIAEMASSLKRPERFAGLHFFNPVNKMPLVEIILHPKTSEETVASLYQWCLQVKKTPIIVKDGPGFLVNRVLATYLNEASYMLIEGVPMEIIEQTALDFGMPMGPFRLMDEVGLDVSGKVAKILFAGLGERFRPAPLSEQLLSKGLLGKKNGKGFYLYSDQNPKDTKLNPELASILPNQVKKMSSQDMINRMILPMINEASYILEEKLVDHPRVIDTGMIYGIGFPPFRGGLLWYADRIGHQRLGEWFTKLEAEVDQHRFKMSELLKQQIKQARKFYQ